MTAQLDKSPVYTMMPEQDHEDIILIAIMDMMFQHLEIKHRQNKKRSYWLTKLHSALLDFEKQYEGVIPEHIGDKATDLNKIIDRALGMMRKTPNLLTRDEKGRFRRPACAGN